MANISTILIIGISTLIIGLAGSLTFFHKRKLFDFDKKKKQAEEQTIESKKDAEKILKETKATTEKLKENLEEEVERRENRIQKIEDSLKHKNQTIERKEQRNKDIKLRVASLKEEIQGLEEQMKRLDQEIIEKLAQKTSTTKQGLKENILKKYEQELKEENIERLARIEEDLKENAVKEAKTTLVNTIQRLLSPTSVESKTILIKVPRDQIKGKIVGKEGSNIEEFETLLDVDIVFNDLPNTISIASYNLVNRRIAQKAIQHLIKIRGGIDKAIVQKAIKDAEKEMDQELFEIGTKTVKQIGLDIKDKVLIKTIGRLQFRTSYGQNIMKHSMEVCWAATVLGSELGLDVNVCRVAGFLHDLGKAIDQDPDVQGAHDFLTKELMEKYNFSEAEIHAAWTHHDSEVQKTPEALIVKAADAISAGRPGARQESLDRYIERLQALEETATKFEGVKKSFAISAGRELRVIVDPETMKDSDLQGLATNVASEIESKLSYPGKIKINVIRRTKHTEVAK
jgi:ribonucrease Y